MQTDVCLYLYVLGGQPLHCQAGFKINSLTRWPEKVKKNEISPLKTKKITASRPNNKFFEFSFKYSQFL